MAFKCPFQQNAPCPIESCALYVLVDPATQKYQCAIVDTAWSLKSIASDMDRLKKEVLPKKN